MSRSGSLMLLALLHVSLAAPAGAQQRVVLPEREVVLNGQPTEVYAVGALAGERWETLGSVDALAFDAQDNLYVLDAVNFRVLVFTADGSFVREIGKQGNGPGELAFPVGLALDGRGNVVVADLGQNGYTVYSATGEFVESVPFPPGFRPAALGMARGQSIASDGGDGMIFVGSQALNAGRGGVSLPARTSFDQTLVRHPLVMNAEPTTLAVIPQPEADVEQSGSAGQMRVMIRMAPPTFSPATLWGVLPNGVAVLSHEPAYAVKIISRDGDLTRIIERDAEPRTVTRRDQDDAREQLRDRLRNSPPAGLRMTSDNGRVSISRGGSEAMTDDQIDQRVRQMTFADVVPMIAALRTDPGGSIWIGRSGDRVGEDGAIDIVRADGSYVGTLEDQSMPTAISPGGLAAWIEPDDMDVPRVVVRRLPASWR